MLPSALVYLVPSFQIGRAAFSPFPFDCVTPRGTAARGKHSQRADLFTLSRCNRYLIIVIIIPADKAPPPPRDISVSMPLTQIIRPDRRFIGRGRGGTVFGSGRRPLRAGYLTRPIAAARATFDPESRECTEHALAESYLITPCVTRRGEEPSSSFPAFRNRSAPSSRTSSEQAEHCDPLQRASSPFEKHRPREMSKVTESSRARGLIQLSPLLPADRSPRRRKRARGESLLRGHGSAPRRREEPRSGKNRAREMYAPAENKSAALGFPRRPAQLRAAESKDRSSRPASRRLRCLRAAALSPARIYTDRQFRRY